MKKLFLLFTIFSAFTFNAQTLSNLVFEKTVAAGVSTLDLTFDFSGISEGDVIEWQLFLANTDGSPNWGSGRNIAYKGNITPNAIGSGTQTVTLDVFNTPVIGEIFTWTGKITLASNGTDTGYNNTGNLVTISSTASANNITKKSFSLYPNPTSDKLFISYLNPIHTIKIADITGKTIVTISNPDHLKFIDMTSLTNGVYFLKINSENPIKFIKN